MSNKPIARTSGALRWSLLLLLTGATAQLGAQPASPALPGAQRLLDHIRTLASDEFEGRAPGTAGEQKTVDYLVAQYKRLGLEPGNPNGTYIQNVPLMGITGLGAGSYDAGGSNTVFGVPGDCVLWSRRFLPEITLADSPLVFVGHGIVAPEYGWDDFKGLDVRGKTILVLVGDPPVPDPSRPGQLDPRAFKGRELTYYGRWTYKFETAARLGAAAALVIHETEAAGYPFNVVIDSNTRERFELESAASQPLPAAVEGWITTEQARRLFAAAGRDFDAMKKTAAAADFKPVALAARARFSIHNTLRKVDSRNVAGRLRGSDPQLRDQYVVYTAHWDHLGKDPQLAGDNIFHGALDNASGVAGLLEIARAFVSRKPAPKRSLLFVALTAEEQGLLGAKYYAEKPLYPLERTLANLNLDGLNPWGRTRDVSVYGYGNSTLQDLLQTAASAQGRVLVPDTEPEKGGFFRADHFEFAKAGVPALYFDSGMDYIGKPAGYGRQKSDEFTSRDYHRPSDTVKPDWDLSGAIEDLQLFIEVGRAVSNGDQWPRWKDGSEFQARRNEMLKSVP